MQWRRSRAVKESRRPECRERLRQSEEEAKLKGRSCHCGEEGNRQRTSWKGLEILDGRNFFTYFLVREGEQMRREEEKAKEAAGKSSGYLLNNIITAGETIKDNFLWCIF